MMAEWLKAGGYQGAENDMAVSFFKDNGAISSVRNDAEKQFLLSKGVAPGQLNDMWFRYLGSLGYLGALNDRFNKYYNTPISTAIHDAFSSGVLPAAYAGFTRGGDATYTNSAGLIAVSSGAPRITYDPSKATDGSTYTVSEVLGANLVSNGGFSSAAGWGIGAGWSVSGGVAVAASASGNLTQGGMLAAGKVWKVTVDVQSYTSGLLYVAGGGGTAPQINAAGTHVRYVHATNGDLTLYLAGSAFSGSVDNVVVEEYIGTQIDGGKVPACLGMLVEGQASDTAQDTGLNTLVTAAQNRTVTATPWTAQFHGTGTVTLSGAHTAVITGTGLYQQASLTFTPSAGTLTMTPSGDVKNLDLINQAYPSSSIVNTTAGSAVRPADPIVLSGSAFTERFGDGSDFVMALEFTPQGPLGRFVEICGASDRFSTTGGIVYDGYYVYFFAPGATVIAQLAASATAGVRARIAFSHSAGKFRASFNGGTVLTSTAGTVTGPMGRAAIGGDVIGGQRQNLIVHDAEFRPGQGSTMSDAALQALSAL